MTTLSFVRRAVISLLLLAGLTSSQQECYPSDSDFARVGCTCDLGVINCLDQPLTEFPVLNRAYPAVHKIYTDRNLFPEINRSHLERFPNLKSIQFLSGRLQRISNDAFKNNTKLEVISLHGNRLTAFPTVTNLQYLRALHLGGNDIQSINAGILHGCFALDILEVQENDVKELRSGVLKDQTSLHTLNLNDNKRLSAIDVDVFENTRIQQLFLQNTAISSLPSKGIRDTLLHLDLSGTRNLKRFNAYEPGAEFFNQTYVYLLSVDFFYHAHCCQMRDYRSYVSVEILTTSPLRSAREVESSRDTTGNSTDDFAGYVCVNTTNRTVVHNTSSISVYEVTSASEFCSSEFCMEEICGERCSSVDMLGGDLTLSGGGISDIYCIEIAPTSCLDKFFDRNSFASQVTYNACTLALPTETPPPTESPTTPPPPNCADAVWCQTYHPLPIGFDCPTCVFLCENHCKATYPELFQHPCPCSMHKRALEENGSLYGGPAPVRMARSSSNNTNDSMELSCEVREAKVVCRERFNTTAVTATPQPSASLVLFPTPSPAVTPVTGDGQSSDCEHDFLGDIGELLLPSGWFYPNPDSRDTICMEVTPSETVLPTPTPSMTPTLPTTTLSITRRKGDLVECSPVPNDFNPCEDLLGDSDVLRAAIWFVIILAIVGNGTVVIVFFAYAIVIRRTKVKFFPMHFLYANLASADFLMSVYLLTLASVDIRTKGRFSREDIEWRTGAGCGFAGFCAITSTVVSVYTLVVITTERLYTITFVMHQKRLTKTFVLVVMIVGWLLGIVIGALPLGGRVNSYELVAVCLPFDTTTSSALAYIVIILLMTGLAFTYIAICYSIIFYQIILSPTKRKLVRSGNRHKQWKADFRMSIRMFVLVATNFLCWFPIAVVSLTAAFGVPLQGINVETAKVFVVFVFPLNACVNPFLYTLSTRAFKHHFTAMLTRCGICRDSKYLSATSRQFGLPSSASRRTTDTNTSRRSSVISQLVALNFTMFTNRRTSLANSENNSSTTNLRRQSQASLGSNEDRFLRLQTPSNLHRNSGASQGSNEELSSIHESTLDALSTSTPALKDKPRNALNSASSLGVLHEVEEVADVPSGNAIVKQNPGYQDFGDLDREEIETCIGTDSNLMCDSHTTDIVGGNSKLNSEHQYHVVANVLQTDAEGELHSDTQSVTDTTHSPNIDSLSSSQEEN